MSSSDTENVGLSYFDLHCDTLTELTARGEPLEYGSTHVSLKKTAVYRHYAQVFAIFCHPDLSPEEGRELFRKSVAGSASAMTEGKVTPYLSVENATILGTDSGYSEKLARCGVRFITPVWSGDNPLGGAYNTDSGLTSLGKDAVKHMIECGIIPDVSHSSLRTFDEIADTAALKGVPFVATHSNSRSVCDHPRNLYDGQFRTVMQSGGIVGISLCRMHLSENDLCNIDNIVDHIEHYFGLGGEHSVCLGCDFDGVDTLPDGIQSAADLPRLYQRMSQRGFSESQINDVFYNNAAIFFEKNSIKPLSEAETVATDIL